MTSMEHTTQLVDEDEEKGVNLKKKSSEEEKTVIPVNGSLKQSQKLTLFSYNCYILFVSFAVWSIFLLFVLLLIFNS